MNSVTLAAGALGVIATDQATKALARRTLDPYEHGPRLGPLGITRFDSARSIAGATAAASPASLASGAGLMVVGAVTAAASSSSAGRIGGTLVAAGAASNLADRARRGSVTDLMTAPFLTWNLADVAIVAGIITAAVPAIRWSLRR